MPRLVLLHTSPRVAAGLLSLDALDTLRAAHAVHGHAEDPTVQALLESGLPVRCEQAQQLDAAGLARALVSATAGGDVVWVGSLSGDEQLQEAIAVEVSSLQSPPDVEVLVGSWDVPGARLLDVVAVMDRLRSPGGCPWDARQTHASLMPYAIEESHELAEAVAIGDPDHIREELGDVLLQVAFHARVAQEDEQSPFDIDDVAATLVDKLVRRHPHVFADVDAETAEQVEANWADIKASEKSERRHPLDGVPASLPSLALADAYAGRLEKAGERQVVADAARPGGIEQDLREKQDVRERRDAEQATAEPADPEQVLGARLLGLVLEAREQGLDAEQALRRTLVALRTRVESAADGR